MKVWDFRVERSLPCCGTLVDRMVAARDDAPPPGKDSLMFCPYCGTLLVFEERQTPHGRILCPRPATPDEEQRIVTEDPTTGAVIRACREAMDWRGPKSPRWQT